MSRVPVAIMISGRGSNMAALIEAARAPDYPADIRLVISSKPNAGGCEIAARAGIATEVADPRSLGRERFEAAISRGLEEANVTLVCLAGFMHLLSRAFVERWQDRLINIHPSLLPAFKGLDTHGRALAAGVRISGCTVHFVRAEMDDGPIIAQAAVPVAQDDTPETLGSRVLESEHRLYPAALALVASGRVKVVGDRVVIDGAPPLPPAVFVPSVAG